MILVTAVRAREWDLEDFSDYKWKCPCCGEEQTGLMTDFAFRVPENWLAIGWLQKLISSKNSDFCKIRSFSRPIERYIRCLLPVPIQDHEETFHFGVWMSISEDSWGVYRNGFRTEQYTERGCFGYLMHNLPDFKNSMAMHCDIEFFNHGSRPLVWLHEVDHPLYEAQREGISVDYIKRLMAKFHR